MFKNLVAKLSLNPIDFFDEIPTRSVDLSKVPTCCLVSTMTRENSRCKPVEGVSKAENCGVFMSDSALMMMHCSLG